MVDDMIDDVQTFVDAAQILKVRALSNNIVSADIV